nr:hypothetical protein [Desulfobacula sp.]
MEIRGIDLIINKWLAVKTMRKITCFICIFTLCLNVSAKAEDVGAKFTSFAGFELGTVTLTSVQAKLGPSKLVETGDAGDYTASICYAVPGGVIMFFAGELDGPEHNLGGFGFAEETNRKPCSEWPMTLGVPNLAIGGLCLGLSISEFTLIVGAPVHIEGKKAYAFFEGKRTITKREIQRWPEEVQGMVKTGQQQNYFDVVVSVVATFSAGRLQELRIWKTETT